MEAKELMIGDWVKIKGQPKIYPMQIVAEHFVRSLEDFEPIPLTEEILKANGIQYQFDNPWYQYENEIHICSKNKKQIIQAECKYVHELQHALRLCGLYELSDSIEL